MAFDRFHYTTTDELLKRTAELGGTLPVADEPAEILKNPVTIKGTKVQTKNALAVHPMEGFDSAEDGGPGELTFRRYERFSKGGAGLFWFEATAVIPEARSNNRQLWICEENLDGYKRLAEMMHKNSDGAPIIMQLTHSGRFSKPNNVAAPLISYHNPLMNTKFNIDPSYPVLTDEQLAALPEKFEKAAKLAKEAGFDGIDVKACHKYLLSETLSAYTRENSLYGGSFENRTRLYFDSVRAASVHTDESFVLSTRFGAWDVLPFPWGFGGDKEDFLKPDFTEANMILKTLKDLGLHLVNITMGSPYINPHINRPYDIGVEPAEHPLCGVMRMVNGTGELKKNNPDLTFIGTGYTYLRQLAPFVAAGAVKEGMVDLAGFGRTAFAYPDFAKDALDGGMKQEKCCITCGKCTELMRAFTTTGCVVRDSNMYAPIYREAMAKKEEKK